MTLPVLGFLVIKLGQGGWGNVGKDNKPSVLDRRCRPNISRSDEPTRARGRSMRTAPLLALCQR